MEDTSDFYDSDFFNFDKDASMDMSMIYQDTDLDPMFSNDYDFKHEIKHQIQLDEESIEEPKLLDSLCFRNSEEPNNGNKSATFGKWSDFKHNIRSKLRRNSCSELDLPNPNTKPGLNLFDENCKDVMNSACRDTNTNTQNELMRGNSAMTLASSKGPKSNVSSKSSHKENHDRSHLILEAKPKSDSSVLSHSTHSPEQLVFSIRRINRHTKTIKLLTKHRKVITKCPHAKEEYYAKGMCKTCYHVRGTKDKKATMCAHVDKNHYAKGICKNCYFNKYLKDRRSNNNSFKMPRKASHKA